MDRRVFDLLKTWCDRYLSLQLGESFGPAFHGAVLCPACGLLHGRSGDMAYPLTLLWRITGEEKYLRGACAAVDWTERSMLVPETGLYRNDFSSIWYGISVFGYMALSDARRAGGDALPAALGEKWDAILARLASGIYTEFPKPSFRPNVNYFAGGAAVMARAWKAEGKDAYLTRAREWAALLLSYVMPDGMLSGEGFHSEKRKTPRGFVPVDLGYNAEESIPLLFSAARDLEDGSLFEEATRMMNALLPFVLPDGGLDNSWGSRAAKWTWYGSRTSDGIQGALLMRPEDPVWREAAARTFALYERLTVDGLLAGGAMHREAGVPVCIHHTFTHAKTLAHLLESGIDFASPGVRLPSEEEYGVRDYPSAGVLLAAAEGFRASFYYSDYTQDPRLSPRGGSMTLLWHEKCGPILAATPNEYYPAEPQNMQLLPHGEPVLNMTPRIEAGDYSNVNDASFAFSFDPDALSFRSEGVLTRLDGKALTLETGEYARYRIGTRFADGRARVTVRSAVPGVWKLPVIAEKGDGVSFAERCVRIRRASRKVVLETDGRFEAPFGTVERRFNPVGGFDHLMLELPLFPG
ncbi:MAG: hypothetical protein IKX85_02120, partial [Clostridia bacterium]|nr:hypothetical protein [Clostridia bacterium]